AGLRSPQMMLEARRPAARGRGVAESYLHSVAAAIDTAARQGLPQTYEQAIQLIMEAKGRVLLLGGRFSRFVSGMLAAYLVQFRSGIESVAPLSVESFDLLVDLGKRDVLVVFDYRRYQTDIVRFARQAAERDVPIVLFTDPWK